MVPTPPTTLQEALSGPEYYRSEFRANDNYTKPAHPGKEKAEALGHVMEDMHGAQAEFSQIIKDYNVEAAACNARIKRIWEGGSERHRQIGQAAKIEPRHFVYMVVAAVAIGAVIHGASRLRNKHTERLEAEREKRALENAHPGR